jgi:DNA polymerase III alpha subunit
LGFYASGSPLDKYKYEIDGISTLKFGLELDDDEGGFYDGEISANAGVKHAKLLKKNGTIQTIAGIITEKKVLTSKKDGRPFGFLTLEDAYGIKAEVALWADKYSTYSEFAQKDKIVVVKGRVGIEMGTSSESDEESENGINVKITTDKIMPIKDAKNFLKKVHLELSLDKLNENELDEISKICQKHKGESSLIINFVSENGSEFKMVSQNAKIDNSNVFLEKLLELPYVNSVRLSQ